MKNYIEKKKKQRGTLRIRATHYRYKASSITISFNSSLEIELS